MNSYDPDFEEWQLGKLSALREIALALEGQYRYYYMGQHCGLLESRISS
jgi:arginine-tRNA-protein transferase